eukprot:gene17878-biopygen20407
MRRRRRRTGAKVENRVICGAAGVVRKKKEGNTQLLFTLHSVRMLFCH